MGKRELIDSTMFIDYILEMIHDVKEQGGFTEIFASDYGYEEPPWKVRNKVDVVCKECEQKRLNQEP